MAQELKHRKGWVAVKELELRRANTKGWAVVGRTSIEQEETAEVIGRGGAHGGHPAL